MTAAAIELPAAGALTASSGWSAAGPDVAGCSSPTAWRPPSSRRRPTARSSTRSSTGTPSALEARARRPGRRLRGGRHRRLDRLGAGGRPRRRPRSSRRPGTGSTRPRRRWSLELADLAEPDSGDLDWERRTPSRATSAGSTTWPTAGPTGDLRRAMDRSAAVDALRLYQARVDGEPVVRARHLRQRRRLRRLLRRHAARPPRPRPRRAAFCTSALIEARERGLEPFEPPGDEGGLSGLRAPGLRADLHASRCGSAGSRPDAPRHPAANTVGGDAG